MFEKQIIVDDYIPYEYDLMDFVVDVNVNKYDALEISDEFDYETILRTSKLFQ